MKINSLIPKLNIKKDSAKVLKTHSECTGNNYPQEISLWGRDVYYNVLNVKTTSCNVSFGEREDIFATSRNGHLLIDTYDVDNKSIDIRSNGLYPANVLSNFANNEFVFDGIKCSSIEGFLQSLKTSDEREQERICQLRGAFAKKIGSKHTTWKDTGIVYWKGREIKRDSDEFQNLIKSAYKACYEQNPIYKTALDSTIGVDLTHRSGKSEKSETILTKEEFIDVLNHIRKN